MISLLGLAKPKKGVKVTIEYCPKNITLPYKVKKLINKASLNVPENKNNKDPFGFTEKIFFRIIINRKINERNKSKKNTTLCSQIIYIDKLKNIYL